MLKEAELLELFKKSGKQLTIGYMMKYHNLHQQATVAKDTLFTKVRLVKKKVGHWIICTRRKAIIRLRKTVR